MRIVLPAAVVALLAAAAPAQAGVVAFSSNRCVDAADRAQRPQISLIPGAGMCRAAIWAVRDDGTGLQRVTDGAGGESGDGSPAWTPSGTSIVFQRARTAVYGLARIFVSGPARGSAAVQLTPDATGGRTTYEDESPAVSPDGRTIVFASNRPTAARPGERQDRDLFAMGIDGRDVRPLVEESPTTSSPCSRPTAPACSSPATTASPTPA